jgi:hypothetical protein
LSALAISETGLLTPAYCITDVRAITDDLREQIGEHHAEMSDKQHQS